MEDYKETFIQVADDCPVKQAVILSSTRADKTIPQIEYELLAGEPYKWTQSELLFAVHVRRQGITSQELRKDRKELWEAFFSKSRACLRASMLPKKYGWGLHFDSQGRIGLCAMESSAYQKFVKPSKKLQLYKAMRSKRA